MVLYLDLWAKEETYLREAEDILLSVPFWKVLPHIEIFLQRSLKNLGSSAYILEAFSTEIRDKSQE